jgi:hypothetical protein
MIVRYSTQNIDKLDIDFSIRFNREVSPYNQEPRSAYTAYGHVLSSACHAGGTDRALRLTKIQAPKRKGPRPKNWMAGLLTSGQAAAADLPARPDGKEAIETGGKAPRMI